MRIIKYNKKRGTTTETATDTELQQIQQVAEQTQLLTQTLNDYFEVRIDENGNTTIVAKYDFATVGELSSNIDAGVEEEA